MFKNEKSMLELQSFKEGKVQLITLRSADREDVSYLDLSWKLQESLEKLNDEESTVVVLFDMSRINLQPRMKYADSETCSISDLLADIKFPPSVLLNLERTLLSSNCFYAVTSGSPVTRAHSQCRMC